MLDRFERPVKFICLVLAALLAWQLASLILRSDPLTKLKIPALPTLATATNEPPKRAQQEIQATNEASGTNAAKGTNIMSKSTNAPGAGEAAQTNASPGPRGVAHQMPGPRGMRPGMMAQMMGGGMPGGPMGGGMKKIDLAPDVQARVDSIIDSEIFGPIIRPMPAALDGISDQMACIRASNGQTDWVKVGGELGGIKLLRIGVNRVLVEENGEKKELTQFGGVGGESLMPITTNAPSVNMTTTNAPSTNAPPRKASTRSATANNASTAPTLLSKEKETP